MKVCSCGVEIIGRGRECLISKGEFFKTNFKKKYFLIWCQDTKTPSVGRGTHSSFLKNSKKYILKFKKIPK
jgi:hypothetical protein